MATVTGDFTLVIEPAAAPPPAQLTIVPANAGGELGTGTEGVPLANEPVCTISGGVPPYQYQITGLPNGVTLQETVNPDGSVTVTATGTPAVGDATESPYSIVLNVTDSAPAASAQSASTTRTIGGAAS